MAESARYRQLNQVMSDMRGGRFESLIKGLDELRVVHDNVMMEACNTSFQVHFQVGAEEFANLYNLAQLVTGPVLAAAVNSPVLLQHRLWHETRVALFAQTLDIRNATQMARNVRQRVTFGERWVQDGVLEIFREDVSRFRLLLGGDRKGGAFEAGPGRSRRRRAPHTQRNGVPVEPSLLRDLRREAAPAHREPRAAGGADDRGRGRQRCVLLRAHIAFGEELDDVRQIMDFDDFKGNFMAAAATDSARDAGSGTRPAP